MTSLESEIDTGEPAAGTERGAARVLIAQPNEDVRELLAEHCRRLELEPLLHEPDHHRR